MLFSIGLIPSVDLNEEMTESQYEETDNSRTSTIDYSLLEEPHDMYWTTEARALSGVQKFLVIDAKWPNHANSRFSNAELDDLFDVTISDFFADASHNQITVEGDVFSINMPDDSDQYLQAADDGRAIYDSRKIVMDALQTADPQVNLANYGEREVIVVLNGPWYNGVFWNADVSGLDENNGNWPFIVVSENDGKEGDLLTMDFTAPFPDNRGAEDYNRTWGRIAHEIGHMLGLSHTTKSYNNNYALLASLYPGQLTGYSMRAAVDWLPDARVYEPAPGTIEETVFLYPLELGNVGEQTQLIKIPISNKKYYLIEVRTRILADKYMHCNGWDDSIGSVSGTNEADECISWGFTGSSLPDEGVLISLVDKNLPTTGQDAQAVTIDLDGDGSQDALRKVGDTFVINLDGKDGMIEIVGVTAIDAYEIKVSYEISSLTPPDIWMPENPPWKVQEIWVDSPLNGMTFYQYHDGDPKVPNEGNGDNPWLGNVNSLCTRVTNIGQLPSSSVPVTFKWKTHNMGLPSDSFTEVGTVNTGPIPGGSFEDVCVNWVPEVEGVEYDEGNPIVSLHACVRAEVGVSVDDPNTITDETETNTDNNQAQENIGHFETTSSSPFHPINLTFTVGNPNINDTWIWLEVSNVPFNWQYLLEWSDDTISPNAEVSNNITIIPPQTMTGSEMRLIHDVEITGYFYRVEADESIHVAELGSVIASVSPADKSYASLTAPTCATDFSGICTATGSIEGGLIGDPVTVIFTSPDGTEHLVTSTITEQSGLFSNTISTGSVTEEPDGNWTAIAVYLGGAHVESSFSPITTFNVEYKGSTSVRDDRTDITANESHTFTDLIENGEPGSSVVIKFISPSEKVFEVEAIISDEGTFSVTFSPTEDGEWTLKYTYEGDEVSTTFDVKAEEKASIGILSVGLLTTIAIIMFSAIIAIRRWD
jgi:hypothetical protein